MTRRWSTDVGPVRRVEWRAEEHHMADDINVENTDQTADGTAAAGPAKKAAAKRTAATKAAPAKTAAKKAPAKRAAKKAVSADEALPLEQLVEQQAEAPAEAAG